MQSYAVLILLLLATGGGLANNRRIRGLIDDEVSRSHRRIAVSSAYWVAMVVAMALYLVPQFGDLPGRTVVYWVVTVSEVFGLVLFAYLELRAHRDA